MPHTLAAIEGFLVTQVKAGLAAAGLSAVSVEPAKSDNALPIVTFANIATRNRAVTLHGDILVVEALYQVVFWESGATLGAADLLAGAMAIHNALHQVAGSNVDGVVLSSQEIDPLKPPPYENEGASVVGLGGTYLLVARGASVVGPPIGP